MQAWQVKWIAMIKKIVRWSVVAVLIIYGMIFAIDKIFPDKFYNCKRDTSYLRGGIKIYGGQKYNIVLCGTGGDENFTGDEIRLQVFSEKGELLAQRGFVVNWITNFPRELEYGPDYVTYYDASQQSGFEHRISMPPTWWDWIKARLPLFDY
ncbi:hypothetical protein [Trinickia sp.]|uniref:hypothetical protein n=1 Tax=Trinickia sp. TaxID=2571163 RepID=UPI003F7D7171